MKIIDLHQDLMTHIRFKDELGQEEQTSFELLDTSMVDVLIGTAFPFPEGDDQFHPSVHALIEEEIDLYHKAIAAHENWNVIKNANDFDAEGKKLLLHVEGLNIFDGSSEHWEVLERWYSQGLRSVGTHWNLDNKLGGGTNSPEKGLTELGAEVILFLEKKSIIFDLAHMSRQGFFDAAKIVERPLYVSHGNAAALCPSVRNYTDEQLKLIADSGGVIGVFFPNTFVTGKGVQGSVHDVVRHMRYIVDCIGVEHVAIGSDFGGIVSGAVEGLTTVSDYASLIEFLYRVGFSETDIEKVTYKNARRVLEAHLN